MVKFASVYFLYTYFLTYILSNIFAEPIFEPRAIRLLSRCQLSQTRQAPLLRTQAGFYPCPGRQQGDTVYDMTQREFPCSQLSKDGIGCYFCDVKYGAL
jgi:hypothetical protein